MGVKAKTAAIKVETLEDKWRGLKGELSDEQAAFNLETTFMDLQAAAEAAFIAVGEGADDAEVKQREYNGALLDAKADLIGYLEEVLKLPPERATKIIAEFDAGNLQYVEDQLAILSRNRNVNLQIQARGGIGYDTPVNGARASGGPVAAGGTYLVGEQGPELLQMGGSSGNVVPNHALGGGSVINITSAANPNAVIAAIKQYERMNGTGWRR